MAMDPTNSPPRPPGVSRGTGESSRIKVFVLAPADVARIKEAGGPLSEVPDLGKLGREAIVPVVEQDGRVVAYWPVFKAVHAEPLWVAPDCRRSSAVIRGILEGVEAALQAMGDPVVFAIIEDADVLESGMYATRLGFQRVPGDLYYIVLPTEETH